MSGKSLSRRNIEVIGLLILVSVASAGCPLVIPIDVEVADGESVSFGDLPPGSQIPEDFPGHEHEYCGDLPTTSDLMSELEDVVGSLIAGLLHVDAAVLEAVELNATKGDFSSIEDVVLTAELPDGSTLVAEDDPSQSDATRLVFVPGQEVDLVDLLERYGGTSDCVYLTVDVTGTVPDPEPVVAIRVRGTLYGHIFFF